MCVSVYVCVLRVGVLRVYVCVCVLLPHPVVIEEIDVESDLDDATDPTDPVHISFSPVTINLRMRTFTAHHITHKVVTQLRR